MKDNVYCGHLVSDDKLEHSSGPWKKHAYVKKTQEDGYVRYWYPNGRGTKIKDFMQNGATDEEIEAAEKMYKEAEEAYRRDPSPENRKRLNNAEEEVSRARAIKRRDGEYEEKSTKEELKKEAKRKGKEAFDDAKQKGKELFSRSKESYRTVETRSMPSNSEAEDRKKKRKSLSLFNHGVRHTGSKKKEKESNEVLKLEPTGKVKDGSPTRQNYNGAFFTDGPTSQDYSSNGSKKPVSRKKNLIGRHASKDAMDDFLQDHPNVHKTGTAGKGDARLSTSIDASPVKDKKLRKQKVGRR